MKPSRPLRALFASCVVLSITACDLGGAERGESSDPDDWSLEVEADSFAFTVVERRSAGGCSYVRTHEAVGRGCGEGALHVGPADAEGNLVEGGFALCGTMTITTDYDEACQDADETTTESLTEVAFLEFSAMDADAPTTMRWRWADGIVFEAEIESAHELEAGGEVGVRFVDAEQASDGTQREVSVDAEIVLLTWEETGGCGAAPGRPGAETLRCG